MLIRVRLLKIYYNWFCCPLVENFSFIQDFQPGGRNSEIKWRTAGSTKGKYQHSLQALCYNFRT